jgi:hypothetical protein
LKRCVVPVVLLLLSVFGLCTKASARQSSSLSTPHFLFTFSSPDRRLAEHLASLSEKIFTEIVSDIGVEPRPGIEIFIEHTHEAFLNRQPGAVKAPEWAAGLAYPELNLIILKAPHAALYGTIDPVRTFRHELAHLTLHQALAGVQIPKWLDEGFAMYEAKEWTFRTTAVITAATLKKTFIPLTSLNHEFPVAFEEAEVAYAQSFSMVAYLLNKYGGAAFHTFVLSLKQKKSISRSTQDAFGLSFYELEQRWHRYLRIRYTWIPIITSTATLWFLFTLVFVVVYLRKKSQAKQKVMEWELEEMWDDSEEDY